MNTFAKLFLVAATVSLMGCQIANADLTLVTIEAPKECPDGLIIKTKAIKGMADFDVSVDADKIGNAGELYKGRVKATANLEIGTSSEQQLASVQLQSATEGKQTRFHFRISPSAIKTSKLYLNVHLFEKDGTPTMGGGVTIDVRLEGFGPNASQK